MKNILENLARNIYYYKKSLVIFWIFSFILFFILFSGKQEFAETELIGAYGTEANNVEKILKKEFNFNPESSVAVAINGRDKDGALKNLLLEKFPQISKITEIQGNSRHKMQLYYIQFKLAFKSSDVQVLVGNLRDMVASWEKTSGLKAYVTGDAAFFYDQAVSGKKDSARIEQIALVLAFFILIFTFGGLLSAFLPILTGFTTITFLNGLVKIFGFDINSVSQILNSMVGLGLAIDYSLFIVSRFREEMARDNDEVKALIITMQNSGKAILFSALIMVCSISVLLIPDVSSSRAVVKNLIMVIFISCLTSLIFLPAFLVYGKNLLNKPLFLTNFINKTDAYTYWKTFARHIVKYPLIYFSLTLLILTGLSLPVLNIKLWEPLQSLTPDGAESRLGYEYLEKDNWGGELIPVSIIVKAPTGTILDQKSISYIYDLTRALENFPKVNSVLSITSWNKNFGKQDYFNYYGSIYTFDLLSQGNNFSTMINTWSGNNLTLINVYPKQLMNLHDSDEIINFARKYAKNHQELEVKTGGVVARAKDFTRELYNYIPLMLGIIFIGIYLLLFFYMQAVILPVKAAIMNFLPILSSFGVLVLIFQYGYFQKILDTPVNGAITTMVPVTLFCIIFGLSMDYEVLILSRITEVYEETSDVKASVIEGLARSSAVITGAAMILLGVFVPGIFSSSPIVKEICIGISMAILIDATIVRLFLVPSFMVLMGHWNWWNPFSPPGPSSLSNGQK
jgi:RND superfamily putative drug exporter